VAPEIGAVSPASGHGRAQTFRVQASYPGGAGDILDVQAFFGESIADSVNACWIDLASGANTVAVRTNDDKGWLASSAVGAPGVVANDKCSVNASQVKFERNGNQLVVTVPVVFADAIKGDLKVSVIASGATKHSGWQERGTWTVE
jgi:hypothetical protein